MADEGRRNVESVPSGPFCHCPGCPALGLGIGLLILERQEAVQSLSLFRFCFVQGFRLDVDDLGGVEEAGGRGGICEARADDEAVVVDAFGPAGEEALARGIEALALAFDGIVEAPLPAVGMAGKDQVDVFWDPGIVFRMVGEQDMEARGFPVCGKPGEIRRRSGFFGFVRVCLSAHRISPVLVWVG